VNRMPCGQGTADKRLLRSWSNRQDLITRVLKFRDQDDGTLIVEGCKALCCNTLGAQGPVSAVVGPKLGRRRLRVEAVPPTSQGTSLSAVFRSLSLMWITMNRVSPREDIASRTTARPAGRGTFDKRALIVAGQIPVQPTVMGGW
jgi:hypothetical protein